MSRRAQCFLRIRAAQSENEEKMKTRLFVGNLAYSTGDDELRAAFEPHGRVVAAEVVTDRLTGQSRGFGFVEFGTVEDANGALGAMHETVLCGRNIQVKCGPRPR
jgi:RNA recognition motif-containing protein